MGKGKIPGMGGMGNLGNLMKQAQKMQKDMEKMEEILTEQEVEATAGGGAITVIADGQGHFKDIKIKAEVVDPDDIEMLQDLILAAVNEVKRKADDLKVAETNKITGGLGGLGGMF
jgi:DNA-binding YbaB/EbfC family protein